MFGASFLHGWGDTARSIPLTEVAPLCFWRGVLIPVRDLGEGGGYRGVGGGTPRCHTIPSTARSAAMRGGRKEEAGMGERRKRGLGCRPGRGGAV